MSGDQGAAAASGDAPPATATPQSSWLPSVPAPIKRVFDRFPLTVYPADSLPGRYRRRSDDTNVLYVFTDARDASHGSPSFNPQCLKWQTYLKFSDISFRTVPSTNHASPSGSLPFLLPAHSLAPIPAPKLRRWVRSRGQAQAQAEPEPEEDSRHEPYMALLDHRIRRAWLYSLYLHEPNFNAVTRRLYIDPATSNPVVRATLASQLRNSARDELLKANNPGSTSFVDVDDILAEADRAFEALSTLLDQEEYFFDAEEPGLFDASVFAYTHLVLDEGVGWAEDVLGRYLRRYKNLVEHRERIKRVYFPDA